MPALCFYSLLCFLCFELKKRAIRSFSNQPVRPVRLGEFAHRKQQISRHFMCRIQSQEAKSGGDDPL